MSAPAALALRLTPREYGLALRWVIAQKVTSRVNVVLDFAPDLATDACLLIFISHPESRRSRTLRVTLCPEDDSWTVRDMAAHGSAQRDTRHATLIEALESVSRSETASEREPDRRTIRCAAD